MDSMPQLINWYLRIMYKVGVAKTDITAFKLNVGMMGYGMHFNTVHDIETPLYSRAFAFQYLPNDSRLVYVVNEQLMITVAVRKAILNRLQNDHPALGIGDQNLFITAQHTHSGPGGYSHYGMYNITIPGFVPQVFEEIVQGTVDAIVEACQNLQPARLYYDKAAFPEEVKIGINRSMDAYLTNPETSGMAAEDTHLALDRTMRLLRIDSLDGKRIGSINWFGMHTTSVHNDNHSICSDNKGYAADYLESCIRDESNSPEFIAAFAQGKAGDVTPNYIYDKKKKWTRGKFEDDLESARDHGKLQFLQAQSIYENAPKNHEIVGEIDSIVRRFDFSHVVCDPEFAGAEGMRTSPACHGVSFFAGTEEGPGTPKAITGLSKFLARVIKYYELATNFMRSTSAKERIRTKYKWQYPKDIFFETGERKVLGSYDIKNLIIPSLADPSIRNLKTLHPQGKKEKLPWVPHILPLQIARLGDLVIVGIPAETTTIAGKRLEDVIRKVFAEEGFHDVILSPYSNAYCGYITTQQEYEKQRYEGGHTIFGKWTLAAFQTKLKSLAQDMVNEAKPRAIRNEASSPDFAPEEIRRRSYSEKI